MVCADAADYGKGQRTKIYGGTRQAEYPATPRIKRDARPTHRGRRGAFGYRFNAWSCGSIKKARCAHRLVDSGSGSSRDKRPWDCCSTITPDAARLYMDFVLSKEGQRLVLDIGRQVARTDLLNEQESIQNLQLVPLDAAAGENMAYYARQIKEIF